MIGSQLHATPFIWRGKGGQLPKPAIVQLVCGYLRLTREFGEKGFMLGAFLIEFGFWSHGKIGGSKNERSIKM